MNLSGVTDRLISYDGGPSPAIPARDGKLPFVPAEKSIFLWAREMGCSGETLDEPSRTAGNIEVFDYRNGDVIHFKRLDKGHNTTSELDEAYLLEFLSAPHAIRI